MNNVIEQTKLEAYATGYQHGMSDGENTWNPGKYDSKLYIADYRDGYQKGMTDNVSIQIESNSFYHSMD